MKIFTIIKEQSNRISDKNFADINGSPLWWHFLSGPEGLDITVDTDSGEFLHQMLSSNLKSIEVIRRLVKHIDWENDEKIDSSPVEDMLFDFCKKIDSSDIVVLTYVTPPFLKKQTILDAVDVLQSNKKAKSIHSVQQVQDFVCLKKGNESIPINFCTDRVQRTQDLSPMLIPKGAFFIARAGDILRQRSRLPEPVLFFPLDHLQAIEIDNFKDLEFARILGNLC